MSIWKVLGGIAAGVGTIAALPVLGAVGAVTVTGAVVGGTIGAVGGAIASSDEDDEKNAAFNEGVAQERARNKEKIEQLLKNLKNQEGAFMEYRVYEEFMTAMFAVGFSVANCDGEMHPDEILEIDEFIAGESYKKIPNNLKNIISDLRNNPPNFSTAMKYVEKTDINTWDIFTDLIQIVMDADNIVNENEKAYLQSWNNFKEKKSA